MHLEYNSDVYQVSFAIFIGVSWIAYLPNTRGGSNYLSFKINIQVSNRTVNHMGSGEPVF